MKSDKYGERRGAAFGLAGVVKGLGLSSLKKYGIVAILREGFADRCYCLALLSITIYFGDFVRYKFKLVLLKMSLVACGSLGSSIPHQCITIVWCSSLLKY